MTGTGDARPREAEVAGVIAGVRTWAAGRGDVVAVALAGSQARGTAGPDSDVDLVVITSAPTAHLPPEGPAAALPVGAVATRTRWWGPVLERRFRLPSGLEVELGFAPVSWAAAPVDGGTARVVADGFVVLHDPSGLLGRLVREVAASS